MQRISPKTVFILTLASLQFFASALSVAMELPCKETVVCETLPCCQPEPSARMECCDQPAPKANDTTPVTLDQPPRVHHDLITPIQFVADHCERALSTCVDEFLSSFHSDLTGNQRYLLLATFLI
jgi:hypothetical protein